MNNPKKPSGWGAGFPLEAMLQVTFGEACSIEDYAFLFGLSALLRPRRILEIGTSQGLGAISIALGASMTGTACEVVTIDKKKNTCHENLKLFPGLSKLVKHIHGDSHEVLQDLRVNNQRFDLCFLDGGHDYQTVSKDWHYAQCLSEKWLFHDSAAQPGVAKLLKQIRSTTAYQVFDLSYPPGHQLDDPTGEWYQTLKAPGFCLVQTVPQTN